MSPALPDLTALDMLPDPLYICDLDTYELLYANRSCRALVNLADLPQTWGACYHALRGVTTPCSFCRNKQLLREGDTYWSQYTAADGRHFFLHSVRISYNGRPARLVLALHLTPESCERPGSEEEWRDLENHFIRCVQALTMDGNFELGVKACLRTVLDYYRADRSYIFQFNWREAFSCNTYEVCAPNITPQQKFLQHVPLETMRFWTTQFQSRRHVTIANVGRLDDSRSAERDILLAQKITSLLSVPLYVNGMLHGFIGVDNPQAHLADWRFLDKLAHLISREEHNRQRQRQLETLSYKDTLTGLDNRNSYSECLHTFSQTPPASVGVAFMDMNELKRINDDFGHERGDEAIVRLASAMRRHFREGRLFRISGDEFVAICPDVSRVAFMECMEKFQHAVTDSSGTRLVACGMTWSDQQEDLALLVAQADQRMYEDKRRCHQLYKRSDDSRLTVDEVTGLSNRRGFCEQAESIISHAPAEEYVILYMNVRRFKAINELFGVSGGDDVLREIAEALCTSPLSPLATGRMEADHFAMLLRRKTFSLDELRTLCQRAATRDGQECRYSLRCGIYYVQDRTMSVSAMCDRAKLAKQSIVDEFRLPYAVYDDTMRDSLLREQLITGSMQEGLHDGQFLVVYQPICDAKTGEVTSAEALVRWQHPVMGLISPAEFIPLFEKNGFITALDSYVRRHLFALIHSRLNAGKRMVPVSANLSRINFHLDNLVQTIKKDVERYAIPRRYLRMEVTESAYASEPQRIIDMVEELRGAGFIMYMDDFGSGYSAFNTLQQIPLDVLKLDMKFLSGFTKNGKSRVVLSSIMRMAQELDIRVIAEGVETKEEYEYLRSIGCDYIQGYYFFRPLPEQSFTDLLDKLPPLAEEGAAEKHS